MSVTFLVNGGACLLKAFWEDKPHLTVQCPLLSLGMTQPVVVEASPTPGSSLTPGLSIFSVYQEMGLTWLPNPRAAAAEIALEFYT